MVTTTKCQGCGKSRVLESMIQGFWVCHWCYVEHTANKRMTADDVSLTISDLLHVLERLNKIERSIPDNPTESTNDALVSCARVDVHNARCELSKAVENLSLLDQ